MKITSKSILSPGRPRDTAPTTLSSSLSRRLKTNGSLKGQASPMFPGKKKGCSFENNPEPSSPKVTCIGQVRVKTKKQGKKLRSRSTRRRAEAQISRSYSQSHFNQQQQELLSQRNQKWVHLPMTICEALRAFGSDLNCFVPCRSSCLSGGEKVAGKLPETASSGGCTAAMARWLVAVQGREIELVVGGDEEEDVKSPECRRSCGRSQRRHVFEDVDVGFVESEKQRSVGVVEEETEEGTEEEGNRVSVCVPPKNALLLMRCRSDPVKMAALANRFWESPMRREDKEEAEETELCEEEGEAEAVMVQVERETEQCEEEEEAEAEAVTVHLETEQQCEDADPDGENEEKSVLDLGDEAVEGLEAEAAIPEEKLDDLVSEEEEKIPEIENQETEVSVSAIEDCDQEEQEDTELEKAVLADSTTPPEDLTTIEEQEIEEPAENSASKVEEEEEINVAENRATVPSSPSVQSDPKPESEPDPDSDSENFQVEEESNPEIETRVSATMAEEPVIETEESREEERTEPGRRSNDSVSSQTHTQTRLPDCLLLMMCEPKLSMEVSKETWVCTTTDFIRRLPERHPKVNNKVTTTNAPDEPTQLDTIHPPPHQIRPSRRSPKNQLHQPPRSSCSSFAARPSREAGGSMAAYEPLALKRCKSEPMRSASNLAQLAHPDAAGCFWNNRRLEPHRPGIGA